MKTNKLTIIYDLETTGFCPMPTFSNYHKVVQICAMCVDTGKIFNEFVNPKFKGGIPHPSTPIHNITTKDVENASTIDIVLKQMYKFFEFDKYKVIEMIAHNNTYFDELVIMKEYKTVKTDINLFSNVVFWDTLLWLRSNIPGLKSYSLTDLYKHFYKKKLDNAHRADADVKALLAIYRDFILPNRVYELTTEEMISKAITDECIVSIRFMGPYRASLCYTTEKIETVSQLVKFALDMVSNGNLKAFDKWLRDKLGIWNITQRFFIVSRVLDIPPWFDELRQFINLQADEDCIDCVDYYIKYRYALNTVAPNKCLYNRGLMNVFHKIN